MNTPTKKQQAELIKEDWIAACESLSNEERAALINELVRSPAMILETQHRLIALMQYAFSDGDMFKANKLKDAAYLLSAFAAACKIFKDKEGQ